MTNSEIKSYIEKREHWKKGDQWWAGHLEIPISKVKEALGKLNTANSSEYDEYDKKENHQNDNKNRINQRTALQDQTLEEYCHSIGIDPSKIDPYNDVKYWTDAAGNRRYSIVPKNLLEEEEKFKEDLIEAIKEYTPKSYPIKEPNKVNPCAGLINIYDAHFDKISQIGEGYTIEDNIALLRSGFSSLLYGIASYKPEVIFFPIGNDFFDTNDFRNTTKKGTPQELSVHWKKSFQMGVQLLREFIDELQTITEEVIIVPIEGNHDEDKVFYLNEVMKVAYENNERVATKESSAPRYYYKYGSTMLGFGHGKVEKKKLSRMSGIVPLESPKIWGDTKHRYMFLGDQHTKAEIQFMRTIDQEGLTIHFLRDIGLTHSSWDRSEAYHLGKKSMEAQIFDIEDGMINNQSFNI